MKASLTKTELEEFPLLHRGKVRDIYEISENELLIVATDRISAFDCILPTPIPGKGQILTALSAFWFDFLSDITKHHLITANFEEMPENIRKHKELKGRSMIVKRTKIFPVECVVRGYLAGSGWKDYVSTGEICGHKLPAGLKESEKLPEPIFTPATKAQTGHDENISESEMAKIFGAEIAEKLKSLSLRIYDKASKYALQRGLILADTKFEFGMDETGEIILADEVLTPDSSRFWSLEEYKVGISPPSFDKQFVRDYLESIDWNKKMPAPELPSEIVEATLNRYLKAYEILTGKTLCLE
ncbi:MAG: phosphoribosylaminoimidazolesuccinocarboxamide synthase [Pyrinomonadaceae bacterium]